MKTLKEKKALFGSLYQANPNSHNLVVARKAAKVNRLESLVDTLKAVGKNKKEILLALVKSGAKIKLARRIYKDAA